jgi:MraZ protein
VPRFWGRFEHSLDAKGRVILPSRFRGPFDQTVFLSQHHDKCVALWTPEEFEKQIAEMEERQDRSPEDRNLARFWASGTVEADLDRQGRVAIPTFLRDYAALESAVLITGALNRIELWNPEEWANRVGPSESTFVNPPASTPVPAAAGAE